MIRAVVFDLDGTLIDFNLDFKAARSEVIAFLVKNGFAQSMFSLKENVFEMLHKAEVCIRQQDEEERKVERIKKGIFSLADHYELEAARTTNLLPGVLKVLETLSSMRLEIALFTTKGKKATNYILERFRIERFFDVIITRENVQAVKPDTAHLETALEALNVKPEEVIIVGDSTEDVTCARRLNVITICVTTGISSLRELIDAGATYVVPSLNDIISLIEQFKERGYVPTMQ